MKPRFRSRSGFPFPAGAIRAATWLLLGGLLLLGGAAFAQVQRKPVAIAMPVQAAITAVTPRSLSLMQAAPKAQVTVTGTNLVTIQAVQVVKGGQGVPAVSADLVQPWPASGKVVIMAGMAAPVGQGYQLRFSGRAGFKNFSFDLPPAMFSLEVTPRVVAQMTSSRPMDRNQPTMPNRPDLTISSFKLNKLSTPGLYSFELIIKNVGKGPAAWEYGPPLVEYDSHPNLPGKNALWGPSAGLCLEPGGTYTSGATITFDAGFREVAFIVDPINRLNESNERNNTYVLAVPEEAQQLPPQQPPDLTITSVAVRPHEGTPSTKFTITIVVMNIGGSAMNTPNVVVNSGLFGTQVLRSLAVGESKSFVFTGECRIPPGETAVTANVIASVDIPSIVAESDENNNTATTSFFIRNIR
jgi:hypothetical protein